MPNITDICTEIKEEQKYEYARGQSWEHCYAYFRDYKIFSRNEKLCDWAALHLGFFLASWGMLRGSGFLLQLNYKYYIPVVHILIDQEFDALWNADCW